MATVTTMMMMMMMITMKRRIMMKGQWTSNILCISWPSESRDHTCPTTAAFQIWKTCWIPLQTPINMIIRCGSCLTIQPQQESKYRPLCGINLPLWLVVSMFQHPQKSQRLCVAMRRPACCWVSSAPKSRGWIPWISCPGMCWRNVQQTAMVYRLYHGISTAKGTIPLIYITISLFEAFYQKDIISGDTIPTYIYIYIIYIHAYIINIIYIYIYICS